MLILYSCSVNKGCQPAVQYYYTQSVSLQKFVQHIDTQTRESSYRRFAELALPVVQYKSGNKILLKLNKEFSLETSTTVNTVLYRAEF